MLNNSNASPIETSHFLLSIFGRPQLLVNLDGSFEQKNGPLHAPKGPTLEFEVNGERTDFSDLQNNYFEIKWTNVKADNASSIYVTGDACQQDKPLFVHNTLTSLFSDFTVTPQGVKSLLRIDFMPTRPPLKLMFPTTRKQRTLWNVRVTAKNPSLVRTPWQVSQ